MCPRFAHVSSSPDRSEIVPRETASPCKINDLSSQEIRSQRLLIRVLLVRVQPGEPFQNLQPQASASSVLGGVDQSRASIAYVLPTLLFLRLVHKMGAGAAGGTSPGADHPRLIPVIGSGGHCQDSHLLV